jgi:hypothetical protein
MQKQLSRIAIGLYVVVLALLVWRAEVKYGSETAAGFAGVGLVFLIVLWRLWRGFRYVLVGGRVPVAAVGQNTQFQPPTPKKAPPRP